MTRETDKTVLIARAIVWVAGQALQVVPIIGPVFQVVGFVSDVAEIRKAQRAEEE